MTADQWVDRIMAAKPFWPVWISPNVGGVTADGYRRYQRRFVAEIVRAVLGDETATSGDRAPFVAAIRADGVDELALIGRRNDPREETA